MTVGTAEKQAGREWLLRPSAELTPLDEERARRELAEIAASAGAEGLPRLEKFLAGRGAAQRFLAAVFDLSPFLRDLARRRPQMLDILFERTVEQRLAEIVAAVAATPFAEGVSEASLMMELRLLKAEAHFLIALAELSGVAETSLTVRRLSDLAGACVHAAVDFLLRDPANPSSILSIVKRARDNARTARTALTREVWEAVNTSWMTLTGLLKRPVREDDLPDVLAAIRQQSAQVRGALTGTMLRNDGYNFARLGTFLERADNTARILDVKYYLLLPSVAHIGTSIDNVQWETILRSVSAHRAYRWLYGAEISALKIAEFLILDERFPRSLTFCYGQLLENLGGLEKEYSHREPSHDLARCAADKLGKQDIEGIFDVGLHQFLLGFIGENQALASAIAVDYRFND